MGIDEELSEKLRKIEALSAGADTISERLAAEAELKKKDPPIELHFSMPYQ